MTDDLVVSIRNLSAWYKNILAQIQVATVKSFNLASERKIVIPMKRMNATPFYIQILSKLGSKYTFAYCDQGRIKATF